MESTLATEYTQNCGRGLSESPEFAQAAEVQWQSSRQHARLRPLAVSCSLQFAERIILGKVLTQSVKQGQDFSRTQGGCLSIQKLLNDWYWAFANLIKRGQESGTTYCHKRKGRWAYYGKWPIAWFIQGPLFSQTSCKLVSAISPVSHVWQLCFDLLTSLSLTFPSMNVVIWNSNTASYLRHSKPLEGFEVAWPPCGLYKESLKCS